MANPLTKQALGCFLFFSFIFSSLSTLSFALSDAEASLIARRQLLTLRGKEDLPHDFEFEMGLSVTFANERLRRAYIALRALKHAIYSDPLNTTGNWAGANVCAYNGVFCAPALDDPKLSVVAGIDLNHADIAGFLPAELGLLTDVALFHINSNRFCGVIPKTMSSLELMYEFDASNNRFVGSFPTVVLTWQSLKYLDLRYNDFEGELPPKLFEKELDAVFLNNNRFTSTIPDTIGKSIASVVTFANNKFSGCIPHTIGNMTNTLNEILFVGNNLSGCFPPEIGLLGSVTVFDASSNGFVGFLPKSFSGLQKVEELDISHNKLTGFVPENVCKLPSLLNFTFAYNYFNREAQACVPSPKAHTVLDDTSNCLPGRPKQKSTRTCFPVVTRPVDCSKHCGSSSSNVPPKPEPPQPQPSPSPAVPQPSPSPAMPTPSPPKSTPKPQPQPSPSPTVPTSSRLSLPTAPAISFSSSAQPS
ncbi:hypothetical protein SLA2020_454200, partial [Shorea laevis]